MTVSERTLEQIVTACPPAADVLARHGLDFCCRGRRPLAEACREAGLDVAAVVEELLVAGVASDQAAAEPVATDAATSAPATRGAARPSLTARAAEGPTESVRESLRPWSSWPLDELIDHIVERFHEPLRRDLAALVALARTVERVHADHPERPAGLADHLERSEASVMSHLAKEERILFPLIREGRGDTAYMPIKVMMQEHDDHGESLRRTRAITRDFALPAGACASWQGLYRGLMQLEAELWKHVHLENYVLFPRAIDMER